MKGIITFNKEAVNAIQGCTLQFSMNNCNWAINNDQSIKFDLSEYKIWLYFQGAR